MVKIIVEFATSDAEQRARVWRQDLVKAIDDAIANIANKVMDREVKVFERKEYTVYLKYDP